jgi:hypothetical protein
MRFKRLRLSVLGLSLMLLIPCVSFAQRERGELRVEARDSQGSAVAGAGELVNELNQVHRAFAGLFSGTAVAAPRSVNARLRLSF